MSEPNLIHQRLGIRPGNLVVRHIALENWGSQVIVDCEYRHPPEQRVFRLVFSDVRSVEWFTQRPGDEIEHAAVAQLMAHDLGQPAYERTARLATTLAEVLISYRQVKIEYEEE